MFLLLDVLGRIGCDQRSRIDDDLTVLEHNLPLDPGLDLPRCRDLFFLSRLPFLCKPEVNILLTHIMAWSVCLLRKLALLSLTRSSSRSRSALQTRLILDTCIRSLYNSPGEHDKQTRAD